VLFSESAIASLREAGGLLSVLAVVVEEVSRPAGLVLTVTGIASLVYVALQLRTLAKVARERLLVVLTLMFFSMLFWSFFEQAGSSINNFTDRNVDRVTERRVVGETDVGRVLQIQPTQEQIGYTNGDAMFALRDLDALRAAHAEEPAFEIDWTVSTDDVGMRIAERSDEVPASVFQSVNPVCILLFGLVFTALWGFLGARGLEPSAPAKFALGLLQLGLGFGAIWYGAQTADTRGMTSASWLVLGYLLHTTGELCLSPVGLSTVTRMSPAKLVSTMMGMWFLATAFSQYLAAIISQFTGVGEGGGAPEGALPAETVHVYGAVFGNIALAAIVSAAVCTALLPWLRRLMHEGEAARE
jgi:POT family proton-dependent oligopeptide transporter